MLLTREEMAFDFKGAKFDRERDRDLLAWIASQFLYGEFTGIQIGHWILQAPDMDSAKFLARQCIEELQHVDAFKEFFRWLGARPVKVHRVVKLLSAESSTWEEHCALEMAQ
ncbi:MAG: ferritin-like domain-containing protein, partial [Planctomycetaceae bacterium]|nr:ferritin-like domain-containing protein [Planctomycetaceae bacterium]